MLKTTTSWLQDQIDHKHAAGGGVVLVPPGAYHGSLIVRAGVTVLGEQVAHGYHPGGLGSTRIVAPKGYTGWVVDVVGGNAGVSGLDIIGNYDPVDGPEGGLRSQGSWSEFSRIHFDGFRGPALKTLGGNACTIDKMLAINSCLDRTVAAPVGVMDIAGNDHYISRVEASASLNTAVSSAALNINAWVIRGTNNFLSNTVGEFADRGYLVNGGKNRFTGVRADRNMGLGYETRGSANTYAACMSVDNSHQTHDTYPSFLTTGMSNTYTGCESSYNVGVLPTYAFEDTVNNASPGARTTYRGCTGEGARGTYKGADWLGSSFDVPNHPVRVGAGNPQTIPVDRSCFIVPTGYTEPITVTDFTRGHSGQTITVIGNPLVTIAHGQGINTRGKAPFVMDADRPYQFSRYNGVWHEH